MPCRRYTLMWGGEAGLAFAGSGVVDGMTDDGGGVEQVGDAVAIEEQAEAVVDRDSVRGLELEGLTKAGGLGARPERRKNP